MDVPPIFSLLCTRWATRLFLWIFRDGPESWDTTDPEPGDPDQDHFAAADLVPNSLRERYHDPIGKLVEISPLDVRIPVIPLSEFYNEPLNETIGE